MAPSVAQLESAGAHPIQVAKDTLKSQGEVKAVEVTESKEEVADKVGIFIYFNSYELTLRSRLGTFIPLLLSLLRH